MEFAYLQNSIKASASASRRSAPHYPAHSFDEVFYGAGSGSCGCIFFYDDVVEEVVKKRPRSFLSRGGAWPWQEVTAVAPYSSSAAALCARGRQSPSSIRFEVGVSTTRSSFHSASSSGICASSRRYAAGGDADECVVFLSP